VFDRDLENAHHHCTSNETALAISNLAGCFYCCQIFPAAQVTEFLEIEQTAICPKCGIDSVIGDVSGLAITAMFLERMHDYWFERTIPFPPRPQ
jgi:hypothetical protein